VTFATIFLFFLYCWGLGFTAGRFFKESGYFLERNLMRVGIGFSLIPVLGLILNSLRVPLDWKIFLVASIAYPLYYFFRNFSKLDFTKLSLKITKTNLSIFLMLLIFAGTFFMYAKGAFIYPYLEDEDPWNHAIGVKYISNEKTLFGKDIRYIDPYPPAFELVMGLLHQTNNSVQWTLKFFNSLFISMSVIFFYFFMKEFSGSRNKALFATFFLAAMPAYLSHFIWSISITMPLFFVSFYALERIKIEKKWWILAGLIIAATLTSSPTHSTYFGFFALIYIFSKIALEKRFLLHLVLAGFAGLLISFFLWWLPMIIRHGPLGTITGLGYRTVAGFSVEGTADRIYTFGDFIWTKTSNLINNPVGLGLIVVMLLIISLASIIYFYRLELRKYWLSTVAVFSFGIGILLIFLSQTYIKFVRKRGIEPLDVGSVPFSEFLFDQVFLISAFLIIIFATALMAIANYRNSEFKEGYVIITLLWLIFSFYAVNAGPFYFKLSPFRAWILLAIPVAILASKGIWHMFRFGNEMKIGILMVLELIFIIGGNNLTSKLFIDFFWSQIPLINIFSISWFFVPFTVLISFLTAKLLRYIFNKKISFPTISIFLLFIILTLTSSAYPKYTVNTAQWPPGAFWTSNEEIMGYIWFKENIPAGSNTFTFSNNALIIGFDKFICEWCADIKEYQKIGFNQTVAQNYNWFKDHQFRYLVVDGQSARKFGAEMTNSKVQEFINSKNFKPIFNNNGLVILEVV
jgi:hypothetical protein